MVGDIKSLSTGFKDTISSQDMTKVSNWMKKDGTLWLLKKSQSNKLRDVVAKWWLIASQALVVTLFNLLKCKPFFLSLSISRRLWCFSKGVFFLYRCSSVVAIDIDPVKVELAMNNAMVYGVANRVDFVIGDFIQSAPSLKVIFFFFSLSGFIFLQVWRFILTLLLLLLRLSTREM